MPIDPPGSHAHGAAKKDLVGLPQDLSRPALRALHAAGYVRLDQFVAVSGAELLTLHGVGPKAIAVLRTALRADGLSFADTQSS